MKISNRLIMLMIPLYFIFFMKTILIAEAEEIPPIKWEEFTNCKMELHNDKGYIKDINPETISVIFVVNEHLSSIYADNEKKLPMKWDYYYIKRWIISENGVNYIQRSPDMNAMSEIREIYNVINPSISYSQVPERTTATAYHVYSIAGGTIYIKYSVRYNEPNKYQTKSNCNEELKKIESRLIELIHASLKDGEEIVHPKYMIEDIKRKIGRGTSNLQSMGIRLDDLTLNDICSDKSIKSDCPKCPECPKIGCPKCPEVKNNSNMCDEIKNNLNKKLDEKRIKIEELEKTIAMSNYTIGGVLMYLNWKNLLWLSALIVGLISGMFMKERIWPYISKRFGLK